ncbi:hypothetical protein OIU79_016285 [Salix purpurea]|uniref:Uncharacterized protein n=1 Tax=Salix purpurea TaxID=77065 RepID=A0A9Q0PDW4_SALPP|nr:hypothetical protein OIU79_016285 [Salix purpurea]
MAVCASSKAFTGVFGHCYSCFASCLTFC